MKALLLLYADEAAWASIPPEKMAEAIEPYFAYTRALREAGKLVMGRELSPSSNAMRVTKVGGERVLDGPYADTKEQLGGFFLIEAPDPDAALELAAKCPSAQEGRGSVEVRPVLAM